MQVKLNNYDIKLIHWLIKPKVCFNIKIMLINKPEKESYTG